jgi:hypothetical protein
MTTFQDREKGYENKFAHDQEKEFKVAVRRNKILGLWVAELLGKDGDSASLYAHELVEKSIEGDVNTSAFEIVQADLQAAGSDITERDLRAKIDECEQTARQELSA